MGAARLVVKVEDDVHCEYDRTSWSAVYHRAEGLTDFAVLRRLASERGPAAAAGLQLRHAAARPRPELQFLPTRVSCPPFLPPCLPACRRGAVLPRPLGGAPAAT